MIFASVTRVNAACATFIHRHGLSAAKVGADLELANPIGSGAFGTVHPVIRIGSAVAGARLVAKVFDPDPMAADGGAQPIIDSVNELYDVLDGSGRSDWPDAVLALPFQLLTAQINGREHLVSLMFDLSTRGYEAVPLSDQNELAAYRKRPLDERTALAVSVCERCEVLADVGFIHGDLNPENVLWNPSTLDVQVIDFDSGVVARAGTERPRTPGKQDSCMPPEVQAPSAPGGFDLSQFTLESERWSYASLVGYFLFTVHPAFFLSEISPTSIAAYATATERWPNVAQRGPLFTQIAQNQRAYTQMLRVFASVPSEVSDLFAKLFDAGLDPLARPAASEWLTGLASLSAPPDIEVVLLSDDIVLEGDDIVIAWRARNATHVELSPGGKQPTSGSMAFVAKEHFRVRVTASNAFGSETVDAPVVRVMPLPRLERVTLTGFRGFEMPPLSIAAQLQTESTSADGYAPAPPSLVTAPRRRERQAAPPAPVYPAPPRFPGLTSVFRGRSRR